MVNQLVGIALSRLQGAGDDRCTQEELAGWAGLSQREVSLLLSQAGLKPRQLKKYGVTKAGYFRLDLRALAAKLEMEATGQSEEPLRDYFCQVCGEVFEARSAVCLSQPAEGKRHRVHVVLNKAPAELGARTRIADRAMASAVAAAGMTDYSTRVQQKMVDGYKGHPGWVEHGGGMNIGKQVREMYPHIQGVNAVPDVATPVPVIGSGTGKLVGSARGGIAELNGVPRRPTAVFANDPSPLPPAE